MTSWIIDHGIIHTCLRMNSPVWQYLSQNIPHCSLQPPKLNKFTLLTKMFFYLRYHWTLIYTQNFSQSASALCTICLSFTQILRNRRKKQWPAPENFTNIILSIVSFPFSIVTKPVHATRNHQALVTHAVSADTRMRYILKNRDKLQLLQQICH